MSDQMIKKLIKYIIGIVLVIVLFVILIDISTVNGNEMGVKETWWGGVASEPYSPKTYVLFPGFMQEMYNYDMSSQVYVMNDLTENIEFAEGREKDSYLVQSKEGQDMNISMNVRWRFDPVHIVDIHKTVRFNYEEKIIRPTLMRIVKDHATLMDAIEAYSGEGLVRLQTEILATLRAPESEMVQRGIIVENFVIEHIALDPNYISEIKLRQIAVQAERRAKQEELAALAEAEKAKAEARADYETQVVEAERDKQKQILAAEAQRDQVVLEAEAKKQQITLAAEADKARQVLEAEGEKEASLLRAEAIVSIGNAEAKAKEVMFSAYNAKGSEIYAKIEIAKHMAEGIKNINGWLPSDVTYNTVAKIFNSLFDC